MNDNYDQALIADTEINPVFCAGNETVFLI